MRATAPLTPGAGEVSFDRPRLAPRLAAVDGRSDYEPEDEPRAAAAFRRHRPAYGATAALDRLRATEYARLDREQHVYLDYTGGSLYAESQLREHMELLARRVLGNPHSTNPTSSAMTSLAESARAAVLRFFNASPDEYAAIFTANATGALKLVAEAYPFETGGRLLLTADNHNSVNGIREFARAAGATTTYVEGVAPDLRVDPSAIGRRLRAANRGRHDLFAYPAQSNFSGVQHPLEWIAEAQAAGWDVLLDCAAFAPTNRLDLARWHPDFVSISFYKLFGYPTGVGCLLVRREALAKLRRPWFAGGTILAVSALSGWHRLARGESGFEDGTLNYLALPAVENGLRYLDGIGIETVHTRVQCLTAWLLDELRALRHSGGRPVVEVYGPWTTEARGGTIAFNFLRPDGRLVDERIVDEAARAHRISLRTGCFCNPGAGETAFGVGREAAVAAVNDGDSWSLDDYVAKLGMQSAGAVRVSLGIATTFTDVYRFMRFASEFRDTVVDDSNLAPRLRC
jgi:selenocysteine lyase/cysteine desulfurase